MMNHDFQMYGLQLPKGAIEYVPGSQLTKKFRYPDIEMMEKVPSIKIEQINPETNQA